MRLFSLFLSLALALQDPAKDTTEFITDVITATQVLTETPTEWITTPVATMTMTPVPTTSIDCSSVLKQCKCETGYKCAFIGPIESGATECPALQCLPGTNYAKASSPITYAL